MKKVLAVLTLILLIIGIAAGIYLVKRQQNIKSKATLEGTHLEFINNSGNLLTSASSRNIKLRLIFSASSSAVPSASPFTTPSAAPSPSASASAVPTSIPSVQIQEAFPTAFRIANFQSGLEFSNEQLFDQNSKEVSWRLSQGNGQKTVYVQFKVNGVWQVPISNQITLNYTDPPGPAYGIQIDVRDQAKIPTQAQADLVKPKWVRFVYPCTDVASSSACPNDWHKTNLINSIPNSDTIKRLAIVNGETAWGSPVGSTDVALWRAYIDSKYLPVLKQVVQNTGFNLSGVELWNEEDHNSDPNVIPYVPPAPFAYLLKSASALIRSINPNLDIVTGGILGNANYLKEVKTADPDAFSDIDAIGVHPYVTPDNINNVTAILDTIKQSNLEANINQPFWITEIGIQEYTQAALPKNQKEFMEKVFDQFVAFSPAPQIVNWYAFIDSMSGSDNSQTWGLFKIDNTIKPSGAFFKEVSSPVLPATPSALPTQATPSATPTQKPGKSVDFNGDGKINSFDISLFLQKWRISPRSDLDKYDMNNDGVINAFDYAILVKNFN